MATKRENKKSPDFRAAKNDIISENVRLMGQIVASSMFDQMKVFEVTDLLVERFQRGTLPIKSRETAKQLHRYWGEAPNRMSERERRALYARTLGISDDGTDGHVNREFNDLWLCFLSSISEYVRQSKADFKTSIPISHQQVRQAARDLAANMSLHCAGNAFSAALRLRGQINLVFRVLSDREIMANYEAHDMWELIDQVATRELDGAKSSSHYRTLAQCGMIITGWLASNMSRITAATGPFLDIVEICHSRPRGPRQKAITHPNDHDLVNSCEVWLANTETSGSSDNR